MSETQTPSNEDFMRAFVELQRKVADISNASVSGNQLAPGDLIASAASIRTGCLLCDGTSYLRDDYPSLFAAIGTTYGSVDGTHFNVPDYRGRTLAGANGGTFVLGTATGVETVTLTAAQSGQPAIPASNTGSTTPGSVTSGAGSAHSHGAISGSFVENIGAGTNAFTVAAGNNITQHATTASESAHTHSVAGSAHTHTTPAVSAAAAASSHSNVQPTLPSNIWVKT